MEFSFQDKRYKTNFDLFRIYLNNTPIILKGEIYEVVFCTTVHPPQFLSLKKTHKTIFDYPNIVFAKAEIIATFLI